MSKKKIIEGTIPRIYQHTALDNLLFGYLTAVRKYFQEQSISKGIDDFMDIFELDEDHFNSTSALVTYKRMFDELNELKK